MALTRPSLRDRVPRFAPDGTQLGTVGRRAAGALIDSCLFLPVWIASFLMRTTHVEARAGANGAIQNVTVTDRQPALIALALALPFTIYLIVSIGRWGRTVGERALRLRVISTDGSMPGWSRSVRRWAVLGVFTVIGAFGPFGPALLAPYVVFGWMLVDDQRQGLHDKFAGVLVVRETDGWPSTASPFF